MREKAVKVLCFLIKVLRSALWVLSAGHICKHEAKREDDKEG